MALGKAVQHCCCLIADRRSRNTEDGEALKVWNNWPDHSENDKARPGNCTTWSRPWELSLKSELMGFDTDGASDGRKMCYNPLWSCFCNTFYKGHFKKGHSRYNLVIWWATEEKSLFKWALDVTNHFVSFVLILIELLFFCPVCVEWHFVVGHPDWLVKLY